MARRIVRLPKSIYKVGDKVTVEGDAGGDYRGKVVATHGKVTKPRSSYDDTLETKPGVTVQVTWWDGSPVDYDMKIDAWDSEVLEPVT